MSKVYTTITGIGQDSHRTTNEKIKPLIIGGVEFDDNFSLIANSDGDVLLHALANAISSITTINILGKIADDMCHSGITNSEEYVKEALKYMDDDIKIIHVAISIEGLRPKFSPKIMDIRKFVANILNIDVGSVGITATTGEQLTEFGKGNGIFVTVIISCLKQLDIDYKNNNKKGIQKILK